MNKNTYKTEAYASSCKQLDINWLNQKDYLEHGKKGLVIWGDRDHPSFGVYIKSDIEGNVINITHPAPESSNITESTINLTVTPCNYGGDRWWFICPFSQCFRRVGKLYFNDGCFGCRHCQNINYESKQITPEERDSMLYKQLKLLSRIIYLENEIKQKNYAGKPTKKKRQVNNLRGEILKMTPYLSELAN